MENSGRQSHNPMKGPDSLGEEDSSGKILSKGLAILGIALLIGFTSCTQSETRSDDIVREDSEHQEITESGSVNDDSTESFSDRGDGEESAQQFGLTDTYDKVRAGARLVLDYDRTANAFEGQVSNLTGATLDRVRVEVHLSNGTELGPTNPVDLAPGQSTDITLKATGQPFATWSAHPEVGSGGESGEHGNDSEHSVSTVTGEHSRNSKSGEHNGRN